MDQDNNTLGAIILAIVGLLLLLITSGGGASDLFGRIGRWFSRAAGEDGNNNTNGGGEPADGSQSIIEPPPPAVERRRNTDSRSREPADTFSARRPDISELQPDIQIPEMNTATGADIPDQRQEPSGGDLTPWWLPPLAVERAGALGARVGSLAPSLSGLPFLFVPENVLDEIGLGDQPSA